MNKMSVCKQMRSADEAAGPIDSELKQKKYNSVAAEIILALIQDNSVF